MKKKSASQPAPKPSWKNAILLAITALALSMSAAFGASTTWRDGTGSWFVDANWYNNQPDSTTDAFINNGGTAQITVDVQALALSLTLGQYAGDTGTVSVSPPHAGLDVGGTIFVGYRGSGKLIINNPGGVTSATASIASLTNELFLSNGVAIVDGEHSAWAITARFDVGGYNDNQGGVALLSVTNGGTVSAGNLRVYNSGTLTGNSTVRATDGITIEGTLTPSGGTITVSGDLGLTTSATNRVQCYTTGRANHAPSQCFRNSIS